MTTHTLPDRVPANTFPLKVKVESDPSRMSPETPPDNSSRLPFKTHQSPLLLRLTNSPSRDTLVVSSPADADRNSTTVSSPSDTVLMVAKTTSSSRTPGDHPGETKDT